MWYVYKITNNLNGKIYIGMSSNLKRRWARHKQLANKNPKYPIHLAIAKYGIENFIFEIIDKCETRQECCEKEKCWIEISQANTKIGYNLTEGGDGVIPSEEVRRKMSESAKLRRPPNLGKKFSEEHKKNIGLASKGRKLTNETKKLISQALKGRIKSTEERQKLSASQKGKPKLALRGQKRSEEVKRKISEGHKKKEYDLFWLIEFCKQNNVNIFRYFRENGPVSTRIIRRIMKENNLTWAQFRKIL